MYVHNTYISRVMNIHSKFINNLKTCYTLSLGHWTYLQFLKNCILEVYKGSKYYVNPSVKQWQEMFIDLP